MKAKKFFRASHDFSALHVSTPLPLTTSPHYCNRTTSNLMATAL